MKHYFSQPPISKYISKVHKPVIYTKSETRNCIILAIETIPLNIPEEIENKDYQLFRVEREFHPTRDELKVFEEALLALIIKFSRALVDYLEKTS